MGLFTWFCSQQHAIQSVRWQQTCLYSSGPLLIYLMLILANVQPQQQGPHALSPRLLLLLLQPSCSEGAWPRCCLAVTWRRQRSSQSTARQYGCPHGGTPPARRSGGSAQRHSTPPAAAAAAAVVAAAAAAVARAAAAATDRGLKQELQHNERTCTKQQQLRQRHAKPRRLALVTHSITPV